MTDLIDRADSEMPDAPGERTVNVAAWRMRQGEVYSRHRLLTADTMIVRTDLTADPEQVTAAHLRVGEPLLIGDLAAPSGRDAWITSGDIPPFLSYALSQGLQDPPTGNPPPLPPTPPTPAKAESRVRFRHRRRLDRLVAGILIGAGVVTAVVLGLDVAALLLMGAVR